MYYITADFYSYRPSNKMTTDLTADMSAFNIRFESILNFIIAPTPYVTPIKLMDLYVWSKTALAVLKGNS